jgi:hypothetical protein
MASSRRRKHIELARRKHVKVFNRETREIEGKELSQDAQLPSQNTSSQLSTPPMPASPLLTPTDEEISDDEKKEENSQSEKKQKISSLQNSPTFFANERKIDSPEQASQILAKGKAKLNQVLAELIKSNNAVDNLERDQQKALLSAIFLAIAEIYRKPEFIAEKQITKKTPFAYMAADLTLEAYSFACFSWLNKDAKQKWKDYRSKYSHFVYGVILKKFPLPHRYLSFFNILEKPHERQTQADMEIMHLVNKHIQDSYDKHYNDMRKAFDRDLMGFFKYFINIHVNQIEKTFTLRAGIFIGDIADCIINKLKSLYQIDLLNTVENTDTVSSSSIALSTRSRSR